MTEERRREGGREGGKTYREQGLDVAGASDHPLHLHQLPDVQGTHFPQGAGFKGRGRKEANVEPAGEGGREGGRFLIGGRGERGREGWKMRAREP